MDGVTQNAKKCQNGKGHSLKGAPNGVSSMFRWAEVRMGIVTDLLINQEKVFIGKNVERVICQLFKWLRVGKSPSNMQTNMTYRRRDVIWGVRIMWSFSFRGRL